MTIQGFKKTASGFVTLLLIFLCLAQSSFAHKVTVFAWVEGDRVFTESKFSGGKKAINAPIEIFDDKGTKILEGRTDENGLFSFKITEKTGMKVVLLAGMGHKAEWIIPIEDFNGEVAENKDARENSDPEISPLSSAAGKGVETPCLTREQIETIVEKAVEKKLSPAIRLLKRSLNPDRGPTVSDIFGGIGYIFGFVGIGAYFNYRKKSRDGKDL